MDAQFILNGKVRLILKPEKESERELLKELMSNGPVTVEAINGNLNILDTNVSDAIIIQKAHNEVSEKAV